ncbi:cell surface protein [Acidovorax sp.]|uniref:cell surface protein n=1 Tax=Acidovorax sp. TaxID=1872122 RepID=UPI002621E7E8|nr:cell surface protein [Acidovorax sp.]
MKKNVLALSIAAMVGGFAGVAQAGVINAAAALATGAVMGTNPETTPGTVAAAAAPLATALEINPNRVGHMLVVPYYTAQNGNMSVIHLTNTDRANGKAVKVRFRGAANSDDVKDFQLYLSPGDVWTGAVLQGADGAAVLYSADNSCTVPAIPSTGTSFATARLNTATNVNGTREGYVEIFNMADIPSVQLYSATGAGAGAVNSNLYNAIKHNASGVAPCSVTGSAARTALDNVALTNYTTAAAAAGIGFGLPTTGLTADWYILNLAQSTAFSGSATAVEARAGAAGAAGAANFVHFPQTDVGSGAFFSGANTPADAFTADPLLRQQAVNNANAAAAGPAVTPLFIDLPDMSTPYVTPMGAAPADANLPKVQAAILTRALSRTTVANQFALDAGINAATDWVFSMPTRRYSVAANYTVSPATAAGYRLYSDLNTVQATAATAVAGGNTSWFNPGNTRVDARGNICVDAAGMRFFDRNEVTSGAAPIFSPAVAGTLSFCGETSVVSFSSQKVLGSSSDLTALTMTAPYANGWSVVSVPNATTLVAGNMTAAQPNGAGYAAGATNLGLPVLGDAFIKLNNDSAGSGFKSTFGVTWAHR